MAFSYTIIGAKNLGEAKMIYGTWDGASVQTGTITFGPASAGSNHVLFAGATQTSAYTTAGSYVGTRVTSNTLVLGEFITSAVGKWHVVME